MRSTTLALTALLTALTTGCTTGAPGDDYTAVLPDERIQLDMPTDMGGARSVGQISEAYLIGLDATQSVNGGIGEILEGIEEITSFDPTWSSDDEDRALWGPWENDDATLARLWIEHDAATDAYSWALDIGPYTANEADWVSVIAGEIEPGATEDASVGRIAIDFTAIDDMGTGDGERGTFRTEYEIRPDGATVQVAFDQFTDGVEPPVDALYSYDQTIGVGGHLDLAYEDEQTGFGSLETVIMRMRWNADGAGRGDAIVTDGDLGPLIYHATECWDAAKISVFEENNFDMYRAGDEAQCAYGEAVFPE